MIRDYGGTNFVTGLRAYAALAVVLIHCGGGGLRSWGEFGSELADLGATGVYVFFVISGFSVTASYQATSSLRVFFVRRILRLAPVYYFFLALTLALLASRIIEPNHWATVFEVPVNVYNLVLHVLFLGYVDYTANNSLIGVEWSLSVEMFWYLCLPPFLALMAIGKGEPRTNTAHQRTKWGVVLTAAVVVYLAHKEIVRALFPVGSEFINLWSPLTYAPAFVLGVAAHQLRQTRRATPVKTLNYQLVAIGGILLLQAQFSLMDPKLFIPLLTFCVLVIGRDDAGLTQQLLATRPVLYLGTISYSVYLWHYLIVRAFTAQGIDAFLGQGLVMFLTVSLLSIGASALTYRWIEVPANQLGRRLGRLLERSASPSLELMPEAPTVPIQESPQLGLRKSA